MEVEGGNEKKIQVLIYELLGTIFFTYAVLVTSDLTAPIYSCLLLICWNISGGHFNPSLTLSTFVAQKKFKEDIITAGMMIGAQVIGSFIGLFWAWITLMDRDWAKET